MPSIEKLSLEDLKRCPQLIDMVERLYPENYAAFVEVLYRDIDKIVSNLQENPELYLERSEDEITVSIRDQLRVLGYDAIHDMKIGGHADLTVRRVNDDWHWIGEAKIHSSYDYLLQGFQQLTTRYSIGVGGKDQGGMLIYIRNLHANRVMASWKDHLVAANDSICGEDGQLELSDCPKNPLAFYSVHPHQRSGLDYRVRHLPVLLYFDPQDRR